MFSANTAISTVEPESQPRKSRGSQSIAQFCKNNNISLAMYFKLQREGRGPAVMKVGRRSIISDASEDAWRHVMSGAL